MLENVHVENFQVEGKNIVASKIEFEIAVRSYNNDLYGWQIIGSF
jgi:hypothetical protein